MQYSLQRYKDITELYKQNYINYLICATLLKLQYPKQSTIYKLIMTIKEKKSIRHFLKVVVVVKQIVYSTLFWMVCMQLYPIFAYSTKLWVL